MTEAKINIRNLSLAELQADFVAMGEKAFRAKQIHEWLWKKHVLDFDAMTNLGKELREKLAARYTTNPVTIQEFQTSNDGTRKYIMRLADGNLVEAVLIPTDSRVTACVSSQVGCSLTCKFCATGYLDLKRNLQHYEIYDQIRIIAKEAEAQLDRTLTNVVYMGMGEPLLNYKNVLLSIEHTASEYGFHFSPRRITLSTAGIAKMIRKLADDEVKFEFALSLHAANDVKRNEIMPINEHNSLEALGEALKYFYEKTNTRVTYEYIIFKDFNDSPEDAKELAKFARIIPSKINIIEYNPIEDAGFVNSTRKRVDAFVAVLEREKHIVNIRRSRGRDVDGACGQLALKKTQA